MRSRTKRSSSTRSRSTCRRTWCASRAGGTEERRGGEGRRFRRVLFRSLRVQAILKREGHAEPDETLEFDPLQIDLSAHVVRVKGRGDGGASWRGGAEVQTCALPISARGGDPEARGACGAGRNARVRPAPDRPVGARGARQGQ